MLRTKPSFIPEEGLDLTAAHQGFLPWSVPAAGLLIAGIVLAYLGIPFLLMMVLALILGVGLFVAGFRVLMLVVLCLPLGYLRFDSWQAQPNPLADRLEQIVTLSGISDGRYLTLDTPKGVQVLLSPSGVVDAGRATLTGRLVEPQGKRNPGGFDFRGYLKRRGVEAQLLVREVEGFQPARLSLKERLRQGVTRGLSERQAALMQAMTLGIRDDLGELRDIFSASGLAHILALSGLHVGILVLALGLLLSPLGQKRYPVLIVLIIGFVLLVGVTPSILRAAAMAIAVLVSLWLGSGRIDVWASLALSALIVLLLYPSWLFDLSFQLSYLAVVGILLFTTPLMQLCFGQEDASGKWWHWKQLLVGSMMVSLSAQALTLPIIASSFGSLPMFSPLVNVFAIPLASLMVPLGFLAGVLHLVLPLLAGLVNLLTGLLAGALIGLADMGSSLPNLIWGEVSALGYGFFYIAMLALTLMLYQRLKIWQALLVVITVVLCSMVSPGPNPVPEIVYFDVGQGDSSLIRLPGRTEILIDGGGSPFSDFDVGKRIVVPALKALGVNHLELVIASHPDTDHIEGLISVLDEMSVGMLLIGVPEPGNPLFDALMAAAARNHVPVREVVRGEILYLGDAALEILNPPRLAYDNDNDNSVAFVLRYKNVPKAVFLGDLGVTVEADLAFPDVDILMAGHHGSRHSTGTALLNATQPRHVVISYGRNTYGHPHPDVLAHIEAVGAMIHETFKQGAVRLPLR